LDDAPAIHTVDLMLAHACDSGVSDIHLEPLAVGLRVRYRIDGILYDVGTILSDYATQVTARIKLLARLDVAEKRMPQDGKLLFTRPHGGIDLRVASFPGQYGEKLVIRILDQAQQIVSPLCLGLDAPLLANIQELMGRAHGFFVVTGPTGSGKTTTLYALLSLVRSSEKNIVTLEDPIEYTIEGITQGQISQEIGFDFAKGIRALLRQDPDVIMVGEMRDQETAQVAIQAALTGHLVLSTLHTADAVGAVVRLLDMGIPSFLINAAITGVMAQRLVRVLCRCKKMVSLDAAQEQFLAARGLTLSQAYGPIGCDLCKGTGYKGRTGVFELLLLTPALRELIHEHVSYDDLYRAALDEAFKPLMVDGMSKVTQGITSVSELMRVLA